MNTASSQFCKKNRRVAGLTLVELIIAIVIASVCAGLGWQAFVSSVKSTVLTDQYADVSEQGRLAMLRISKELRGAIRTGMVISPNTEISFTTNTKGTKDPADNESVRYYLDGTNLRRAVVAGTTANNILATGISDLVFTYDTADPTTLNFIQVQFTARSLVSGGEYAAFKLRDRIYPRNY